MWISALVTLLVVGQASCQDMPWDTLRVTFGIPLFTAKDPFHELPLTVEGTKNASGFVPVDGESCSDLFKGIRYYNPNDLAVSLLYDKGGNVAGIQNNFEVDSLKGEGVVDWFEQGNMYIKNTLNDVEVYTVTAYLTDPEIICTTVRSEEQVEKAPSGNQLYIQTKDDLLKIPLQEEDVAKESVWTKGNCFLLMGQHYWYDISKDMDCNDFKPVFLLYDNQGHLTGFGITAIAIPQESIRFEHPPSLLFPLFMQDVPECLLARSKELGGITTMHVYLNFDGEKLTCP